jgi:hypothetical protein
MRRLVGALLSFTWALSACIGGRAAPPSPANLVPEDWQEVRLRTICLEVQQSFPGIDPSFSLPVEPALRRILPGLGLRVVASDEACDGALHLSLQGEALAEDYVCVLGNACGHCFAGGQVSGELILTSSDRTPWVHTISAGMAPPFSISACPKLPQDAPLGTFWPRAVLGGLLDLWGTPVLAVALGDREEDVRQATVWLLQTQGKEGVPLLVKALRDRSADMRRQAANVLGLQGAEASDAVPALIEVLDDSENPVRLAATEALHLITGQDFGQDQAAWRRWLKEPGPTPTPLTSWSGVPIMPGATSTVELGSAQVRYVVRTSCGDVVTFYKANMPGAGWSFVEESPPDSSLQALRFEKGGETGDVQLTETQVTNGEARCRVDIFLLR